MLGRVAYSLHAMGIQTVLMYSQSLEGFLYSKVVEVLVVSLRV